MASLKSPAPTLVTLRQQLKELQSTLSPVLAAPLASLTSQLEAQQQTNADGGVILSGCLQSAQLQSSLAYVLLDLVWILLKLNGTEPAAHPVTAELKRVQQYMQKVHSVNAQTVAAEYGSKANVEARQAPAVDAAKASRFIKGALGAGGAKGKRTIFADDGTVQSVVSAGEAAEATDVAQDAAANPEDERNGDASQSTPSKSEAKRSKVAKDTAGDTQKSKDAKPPKKKSKRHDQ